MFDWEQLYVCLRDIAQGLQDGTLPTLDAVFAKAYTPVISKYDIECNSLVLAFGVYRPATNQRYNIRQCLLDLEVVQPTSKESQLRSTGYAKRMGNPSHWKTVMSW